MNVERLNLYGPLMLVGILLTAWMWGKATNKGQRRDSRLVLIYFAALIGAVVGAKLAFLLAEGWHYRDNWMALLSGRSITGGLLGGYAAVEIAKRKLRYRSATGDLFALLVPLALALGRIGCAWEGCCAGVPRQQCHWWTMIDETGVPRWPAPIVEICFNLLMLGWALLATRCNWTLGNRFHVYLIAYGLFRFAHEFLRERIELIGPLGGYHLLALALAGVGLLRFVQRRHKVGTARLIVQPG